MKTIVILFTLFYFLNALAVAPYGFKGQQQASTLYSNVLQVPNNQVTNLGGINALVETGNQNILVNPSFEHDSFSTAWVNSAGTLTEENSIVIDGKASAKLVLSAQTMSLTQSSSLYQAQFAAGLTGIASVSVKSDVALKVCSIQAGVVSSTNCVNVATSNTWGVYSVKFNLGATSNGISIASTGAVTGTVYIDNAYVGISAPSTEACSSTLACTDVFSAKVSAAGVVSDENANWINGNCSVVGAGFTCTYNTGIFSVTPNCTVINASGNAGGQSTLDSTVTTSTSLRYTTANAAGLASAQPVTLSCQKQGTDYIGRTINAVASDQNTRSPGVTNSVMYRARIADGSNCTSSPCTISFQNGSWLSSVTRGGTGQYTLNIVAGKFLTAPSCSTGSNSEQTIIDATSATSVSITCRNNVGTLNDCRFTPICVGEQ